MGRTASTPQPKSSSDPLNAPASTTADDAAAAPIQPPSMNSSTHDIVGNASSTTSSRTAYLLHLAPPASIGAVSTGRPVMDAQTVPQNSPFTFPMKS